MNDLVPQRISPSQMYTLHQCPRAYAWKYIRKVKGANDDAEYFIVGRALHEIVQGSATPESVDLRPLDEAKKNYRAMLAGMAKAVAEAIDLSKVSFCETAIRTESETLKIDGVYLDGENWWIFELKSAAQQNFNLEEKIAVLSQDTQLAAYVTRKEEIASELFLLPEKFQGVKYVWALKPSKKIAPDFLVHTHTVGVEECEKAPSLWRNAKGYARMILDVIRTTYAQRNEIFDVPCNTAACTGGYTKCGYFADCYPEKLAPRNLA